MTTYYVSTTGNDSSSGTISSPWKTIQKAANTLVAGDTAYIRGGTYKEYITPMNSGNSTSGYITYTSYPGETAIIDLSGMSQPQSAIFTFNTKNYIKISGLTLQNNNPVAPGTVVPDGLGNEIFGVSIGGTSDHLIIEKNIFNNIASSAVWSYGGGWSSPITNIIIDGNTLIDVGCRLVDFTTWTRGVHEGISIYYTNDVEIKNNKLTSVWTEGIATLWSNNILVHHNYVPAGPVGINARCCNLEGIYLSAGTNIEVYDNIIDGRGGCIGTAAEYSGTVDTNFKVYNNIIMNSVYDGIILASWGTPITINGYYIVNNTIINCASSGINLQANGTYQNVILRNNLLSGNGSQISAATLTGVTVDHNLFNGSTSVTGTSYINGDPKFVSPTDFHLQSTSPAIDKGSSTNAPSIDFDNVSRPQGAGFDIGAYEYSTVPACTQPAVAFTLS